MNEINQSYVSDDIKRTSELQVNRNKCVCCDDEEERLKERQDRKARQKKKQSLIQFS